MNLPTVPKLVKGFNGPIRILNIGPPGGGKTTMGLSMPYSFFFDFDHRLGRGLSRYAIESKPNYVLFQPNTWKEAYAQLLRLQVGDTFEYQDGVKTKPHSIVIDTLSPGYEMAMRTALSMESVSKANTIKAKDAFKQNENMDEARIISNMADFGLARTHILRFIGILVKMECHLLVNVHEYLLEDELTKTVKGVPNLPGRLQADLPGSFDIYGRTYRPTAKDVPIIQTAPDGIYKLKDATGYLAPNEPALFKSLAAKIYLDSPVWQPPA